MASPPKPPAPPSDAPRHGKKPRLDSAFMPGDMIPTPDVKESSSDTDWAMWHEVKQQHEAGFLPTAPGLAPSETYEPSTTDPLYAETRKMGLPSTRDGDETAGPLEPPSITMETA